MVKPNNDTISRVEKIKDEVLKPTTEATKKRKYENKTDEITLLGGLSIPKNENVPAKKKKIATADKILKLEQEKV